MILFGREATGARKKKLFILADPEIRSCILGRKNLRIPGFDRPVAGAALRVAFSSLFLSFFLFFSLQSHLFPDQGGCAIYRSATSCHWIPLTCVRTFLRALACVRARARKDWIEIMVYNSPARKTGERALPSGFLFPFPYLPPSLSPFLFSLVLPLYVE